MTIAALNQAIEKGDFLKFKQLLAQLSEDELNILREGKSISSPIPSLSPVIKASYRLLSSSRYLFYTILFNQDDWNKQPSDTLFEQLEILREIQSLVLIINAMIAQGCDFRQEVRFWGSAINNIVVALTSLWELPCGGSSYDGDFLVRLALASIIRDENILLLYTDKLMNHIKADDWQVTHFPFKTMITILTDLAVGSSILYPGKKDSPGMALYKSKQSEDKSILIKHLSLYLEPLVRLVNTLCIAGVIKQNNIVKLEERYGITDWTAHGLTEAYCTNLENELRVFSDDDQATTSSQAAEPQLATDHNDDAFAAWLNSKSAERDDFSRQEVMMKYQQPTLESAQSSSSAVSAEAKRVSYAP
jgi:hypothetical protein